MTRRRQRSFRPAVFLTKIGAKSFVALFREGQAICSQGDPSKEVFYIEKGQLKFTVRAKRSKETALCILHHVDHLDSEHICVKTIRTATTSTYHRIRILVLLQK